MYAKETRAFPGRGEILEGKGGGFAAPLPFEESSLPLPCAGVIGARRCRGRVRVGVEMAQPDSTPDE